MTKHNNLTNLIKARALELGFDACGISRASMLEQDEFHLDNWLKEGMHGEMGYMANHFEKRVNPKQLVEGAKSVISVLLNYFPEKTQLDPEAPIISKYAYGSDYHFVMKPILKELLKYINEEIEGANGRVFVDSAPVMEKAWAAKSGLGWIGKNSMLISKKYGSFVFLGEIIVNVELDHEDLAQKDFCGTCTRCVDACPTGAIVKPYVVDGSKCISYYTIETKGAIPAEMTGSFENRVFGCDICQDVCPWNSKVKPHKMTAFEPKDVILEKSAEEWYLLSETDFKELFRSSALQRTKYKGFRRNLDFIAK